LCGFLATVEGVEGVEGVAGEGSVGERLVGLKPDPSRFPYDEKVINGCHRWRMNLDEIDGPARVNYPLKRVGKRGSGKWERVSWGEALDDIAARLSVLAEEHGTQTLASAIGGPHATYWPLHRFLNLWGSPNNMGIGQICWNTRIWMDTLAYGWPIEADIVPDRTAQVFLWGTNPAESDNSLFWRQLRAMSRSGTPLVVIDPRKTRTARIATLHLAPRPGTDCTLALALIREILASGRADDAFIARWCHGFDELAAHVQPYTLAFAEKATGIPAEHIARAAALFSEPGPSALLSGRGIDQLGPNTAPTHRALSALRAITGDVDRPGACTIMDMSDFIPEIDLEMSTELRPEKRAAQLNLRHTALQSYPAYESVTELTSRLGRTAACPLGKRLPMRYLTSAHPNLVWRAMATGEPYRVGALICMAANPLVTYADTRLVHRALHELSLLVVLEHYLTPTAQLADYVLPSAGAFERPLFQAHGGVSNFCYGGAAAVAPYHERRCDYEFFRELGCRLGQAPHWPHETLEAAIQETLAPTGMSWKAWSERGIYYGMPTFAKHELPALGRSGDKPTPQGFATTTGKIELASAFLEGLGSPRLPEPVHAAVARSQFDGGPAGAYTLITGARTQPYWASSYFNNARFREMHPHPTAQMSAVTLQAAGLVEGQWVEVATSRGHARFVARESSLVDGVVSCEYGWWYPEEAQGEPHLSGLWRSNVNCLTSADIDSCEPLLGSWAYNGLPCTLRPLSE
jgi:anaerobic selenocysteine-containing dehydrogenase